ncbi:putative serine/threonine-protein kinase PknA [Actinoplanes ianthinogenes]|uniref:non-specific serine/threonine protein kinase n=1 Tax=Actinoplanes ianthinogenes TaxID=122358 RepID=A0ABN6CJ77_9ACTN|nr:serine/threonine-protein kinase [Actinoplanes ianthinogenes]BCJ45096.1 putative serine/threonine-protein kinase PknA [Actinoplanes ianthinogenes]GGR40553.1 putative serine/threonine-protein kinase PknA [Actinoplanes ianthinogenes]
MLSAGHLLDNRYRLDERIATGGMGDVWRGTDVVLGRVVAVKVLRTALLDDPEFAARFYGEARMMAAFRHPGVVEVYDYAEEGDAGGPEKVAYLVMAFVEGEPLSNRVKQGPLPVSDTLSIVAQAAEALHAAHEAGIVHRDIKPGNLIVKPSGAVILIDFGVARSNTMTSMTGVNSIVGTALYMAPEQVAKGNLTPGTDVYALGAVAYHCIAGQPPFDGDNALQVALRHLEDEPDPLPEHVPAVVRELIARAMAKQPADRYASAAEFAEAAYAAVGAPQDWKRLTGTALIRPTSGAPATAPVSPARPTQPVHRPRMSPAPPPMPAPDVVPVAPRAQRTLMIAVIALFVLAGGLGVAWALSDKAPPADASPTGVSSATVDPVPQTADPVDTDGPAPQVETTTHKTTTTKRNRTPSASASVSATPSVTPSESPSPTPSKTEPTTKPTDDPTGGTTTGTATPTGTTPPADPGTGGGSGTNG